MDSATAFCFVVQGFHERKKVDLCEHNIATLKKIVQGKKVETTNQKGK
jgi:hypothetical protein